VRRRLNIPVAKPNALLQDLFRINPKASIAAPP
jgi:hypothetical protein